MSELLKTTFAGVEFDNPVTTASGTFGSGMEYGEFVDLHKLGAVTTKGVANVPWPGNPTPRIVETHGGMLNAIGLQNPGIDTFISRDLAYLHEQKARIIVNVCGRSKEDYVEVVERLAEEQVDMLEINISCPNVKAGGIAFGQKPEMAEEITRAVKKVAAGDHEIKSQCNRYNGDGKGSRGRRRRRCVSHQYADRNEDRCKPQNFCCSQSDRWYVRSVCETGSGAYGISGGGSGKNPDPWHGGNPEHRGCTGISHGRSYHGSRGNSKFFQSICHK